MLARALLLGLLALASFSSRAWATGPAAYPPGGSGSGVVANTCSAGDFFSAVDGSGNFTCATPSGSGDVTAVGDCASGACFTGTTGSTLTGATGTSLVLNSDNNIYLSFDTDNNSTATGVVIGSNASGSSATPWVVVSDAAGKNMTLRNATTLRINDPSDDTNYVEFTAPTIGSNVALTLPTSGGTVPSSATSPLALSAAGALSITADGIGSTELAPTFTATTITSNLVGNVTGNADTSTALAANPADCAADTYATTIAASGALTCATVTNAGLAGSIAVSKTLATGGAGIDINTNDFVTDSSETSFLANSTSLPGTCGEGAVYQDTDSGGTETYVCTAANTWTKTIAATDNVATATALAANPADCGADTYATTIAASGALTCATVTNAGLAGSIAMSKTLLTADAGLLLTTNSLTTKSDEQDFLAQSASLSCAGTTPGKLVVDTTTQTLSYCPTGSTTTKYAALGDDNGRATFINATSCTNGVQTASDGTPSCITASSTPEYVSRIQTAGGTLGNYAVVAANGSNDDEVIEAITSVTQILGCSQDGDGTTSTNPVEVAVSGIARCKADTTVVAGSLVKLGATGEFALATTADKTWGRAVTDDDGAGSAYVLLFDGAEGYIDHIVDLWPSVPDVTTNTLAILGITPTVDITSTGTLRGINISPTTAMSGIGTLAGVNFGPTFSFSALVAQLYGFNMIGTYTSTDASASLAASILRNNATYTSSTPSAEPFSTLIALDDKPVISQTATSGSSTPTSAMAVNHAPAITLNDTNGATGGLADMTLTEDIGLKMSGSYTETAGTLTITNRFGLDYNEVTNTGADVTNNFGVDIAALTVGTNRAGVRNADATVFTPCTDDVSGNTDYLARPECTAVNLTAGGARDLTAGTDQIADGLDGQIVTYFFSGSNSVKFDDADNVNLNSEAAPTGGAITLSAGDTLTLLFSSTRGEWLEVSRSNN